MATKASDVPPDTEPDDEPKPDDGGGDSGDTDDPGLVEKVESTVRRVLGNMLGRGDVVVEDEKEHKDEPAAEEPRSLRRVEADTESEVRAALAKIKAEEDRDARLSKVEKEVFEKPPVKVRRATRVMGWGD